MDIIDTIDTLFQELLPQIIKCNGDTVQITNILNSAKTALIYISACNPINTSYLINAISAKE